MFTSIDSPRANTWFEEMQRNRKEGKEPPFRQLEVILDDGEVLEIYHDFIGLTGWIAVFRIYEPDGKTVSHTIATQLGYMVSQSGMTKMVMRWTVAICTTMT